MKPTTLCSLGRVLYQLSYLSQGNNKAKAPRRFRLQRPIEVSLIQRFHSSYIDLPKCSSNSCTNVDSAGISLSASTRVAQDLGVLPVPLREIQLHSCAIVPYSYCHIPVKSILLYSNLFLRTPLCCCSYVVFYQLTQVIFDVSR